MNEDEGEIDLRSKLPTDLVSFLRLMAGRLEGTATRPPIIPTPIRIAPLWLVEMYDDDLGSLWKLLSGIDVADGDTED